MTYTQQDVDVLARTIYGEARGELYKYGIASLIAIANVIYNRYKKKFGLSIEEICLKKYQFSCWNKNDPNYEKIKSVNENQCHVFRKCIEISTNILSDKWPDLTDGCDHYHATFLKPSWALYQKPKYIFGDHAFYSIKNYSNN